MEPFEENTMLSPQESIINILGRLFNNGHISSEELMLMQQELVMKHKPVDEDKDLVTRLIAELVKHDIPKFTPPSLSPFDGVHLHPSNPPMTFPNIHSGTGNCKVFTSAGGPFDLNPRNSHL
jgi:hypothetical protein